VFQNSATEPDYQKAVNSTADGLVLEAIEQMIGIKKHKETASSPDDLGAKHSAVSSVVTHTPVHSVGTSTLPYDASTPVDNQVRAESVVVA
jgi:hypothetical protein